MRIKTLITLIIAVIILSGCGTTSSTHNRSTIRTNTRSISKNFNRINNVPLKDRTKVDRIFRDLGRSTRDREVKKAAKALSRYTR